MTTDSRATGRALEEAGEALVEFGTTVPTLRLLDVHPNPSPFSRPFRARFPDRSEDASASVATAIDRASKLAADGTPVFVAGPSDPLAVEGFAPFRRGAARLRRSVKLVSTDGGWSASDPPVLEDIALLRGLPGLTLVLPGDAVTARSAVAAVGGLEGPAYLRISDELPLRVGDVPFQVGQARELRDGRDLAIVAAGAVLALALQAAEELDRVGLHARVLDSASISPLDEKAILRAARDTGAILTIEDHQAATGLGASVAALTAENAPVPVRRLGLPDLFGDRAPPGPGRSDLGLTLESALEEAWELLRLKGKVQ